MVKLVNGDLLDAKETYIVHQVNCYGMMGKGIALQIKNRYPDIFRRYQDYCNEHKVKNLIGRLLLIPTDDGKVICNLFGQERFGYGKQYTDIAALSKAMNSLAKIVPTNEPIAMPYMIGCGNGGADWNIVHQLIQDIFKKHTVVLYKR